MRAVTANLVWTNISRLDMTVIEIIIIKKRQMSVLKTKFSFLFVDIVTFIYIKLYF